MSQQTVNTWLTRKKGSKKQKGQKFPVSKKTKKAKPVAKKSIPETSLRSKKAELHFSMGKLNIDCNVRWETEKVEPMVKIGYFVGDTPVFKRYEGPKKTVVWRDVKGKHYNKAEIRQKQMFPDGKTMDITPIKQTKNIVAEAVDKDVMNEFLPAGYVEMWAEKARDQQDLQKMALELVQKGKVAAVSKFARSVGTKVYVGFIYPVLNPDTDEFTMEMMISENIRRRRRWMSSKSIELKREAERKTVKKEVKVPKMW